MISFGPQLADWARSSEALLQHSLASPTATTFGVVYDYVSRRTQRIFDLIGVIVLVLYVIALIKGGIPDASRAFLKWERYGTAWDPPIPAVLKPLILVSMILITLQAINNLIVDWNKPKEKAYDPAKDL